MLYKDMHNITCDFESTYNNTSFGSDPFLISSNQSLFTMEQLTTVNDIVCKAEIESQDRITYMFGYRSTISEFIF